MVANNVPASLSISVGSAPSPLIPSNGTHVHVDRLQDFQAKGLAPKSLQALGIILSGAELSDGLCFNPMNLSAFVPALQAHATVHVCVVGEGDLRPIHTSFLLAGLKGFSESRRDDGSRVLSATVAPPALESQQLLTSAAPIKLLPEEDLVDEDALLSSNVLAPPPAMSAAGATANGDDCAGRQPCDNCTCGRADAERADRAAAPAAIPSSSCGKCHLGDAFRCASCPHLGKPAFKPGEDHLVLDLQDDL